MNVSPDPKPAGATPTPVAGPALIATLLASVGFGLVAMSICLPSLPEWHAEFTAPQADVQLTFSAFVIGLGIAQLLFGALSDQHGRRPLLLLGLLLATTASLAAAFAPGLIGLTIARFFQGAGAAAGMVIGRAMVQDYFGAADRARVMAYVGMVMGMCPPLATIIGGQVHVRFGWRANFILTALLALALLMVAFMTVPHDRERRPAARGWLRGMLQAYMQLARIPAFLAYASILGMCTGTFYLFLAGAPSVLASYGVGPDGVGFYIMFIPVSYILGNFLTSRLLRAHGEARLMLAGQLSAVTGIAIVLVLGLADVRSAFALAIPLILLGVGHGLLMPSTLSGTVGIVPALAGSAVGMAGVAQHFFGAVGGYAIGFVAHDSAVNLALLMLAFMLFSLFCQLILRRLPVA